MKNKKILLGLLTFFGLSFSFLGTNKISAAKAADSFADLSNPANWSNLPGYVYKTEGVLMDNDGKKPAEVTFPTSVDSTGIDVKVKGYYATGSGDEQGNMFSGLVYKNKVKLEDLSVTFTINSLGANSAIGDDGWISVAFLTKENMFSTTNTNINTGAIALLRTQTRSITVYDHEIGEGGGEKWANFATGTSVSLDLDTYPSCEGSTIRVSYVKQSTAAVDNYFLKVEQLDFDTKEVIASKTTSSPLQHSDYYLDEDGKGYFCLSASTNNWEKEWDISIKNINGVDLGNQSNVKPMSSEEKAEKINTLVESLKVFDYFNTSGTLSEEGKAFYSPTNSELNVNDLVTQLSSLLHGLTNADADILYNSTRIASSFDDATAFKNYLISCSNIIIENYESIETNLLIEKINNLVAQLPELKDVSISNEQKVTNIIKQLEVCFYSMKDKATQVYGADNKQHLWDEIIVKYSDKLDTVKFEKFSSLVDGLPEQVNDSNLQNTISDLIPAELILEYFSDESKISDLQIRKPDMYSALMIGKTKIEAVRSQIEAMKQTQRVYIEDLEKAAEINYYIYYLVDNPTADDTEQVFSVLSSYMAISSDAKDYVEDADKLFSTCANALKATIDTLPELTELTKDSYVVNSYDVKINDANMKYTSLKNANRSSASLVTNYSKLEKLVDKLNKILNPLGANTIMSKQLNANTDLKLDFVTLFTNYSLRNYEVTTNYGTVDLLNESVTFKFDKNGEYNVEVKITDIDYGDTATCKFKITVTGATEGGSGCGGSIIAASAFVSLFSLCGVCLLKGKKRD